MYKTFERFDKPSIEFVTVSCNIHRLHYSASRSRRFPPSGDFDVTCPALAILAELATGKDLSAVVDFANDWAVLANAVFLVCRRQFIGPCRYLLWRIASVHRVETADSVSSLHCLSEMHSTRPQ